MGVDLQETVQICSQPCTQHTGHKAGFIKIGVCYSCWHFFGFSKLKQLLLNTHTNPEYHNVLPLASVSTLTDLFGVCALRI